MMLSQLVHLLHLFFAFLEAPEVILNEKRGVELSHGNVVVSWIEISRKQTVWHVSHSYLSVTVQ